MNEEVKGKGKRKWEKGEGRERGGGWPDGKRKGGENGGEEWGRKGEGRKK